MSRLALLVGTIMLLGTGHTEANPSAASGEVAVTRVSEPDSVGTSSARPTDALLALAFETALMQLVLRRRPVSDQPPFLNHPR
jgi:hypothetical protein